MVAFGSSSTEKSCKHPTPTCKFLEKDVDNYSNILLAVANFWCSSKISLFICLMWRYKNRWKFLIAIVMRWQTGIRHHAEFWMQNSWIMFMNRFGLGRFTRLQPSIWVRVRCCMKVKIVLKPNPSSHYNSDLILEFLRLDKIWQDISISIWNDAE